MGQAAVIAFTQTLESETCFKCGVLFAMPSYLIEQARRQGGGMTFYCPNGHGQSYIKSEVQRLKEELAAKDAVIAEAKRATEWEKSMREIARRDLIAQKGVTTKLRKRIAAGVCPCCKRTVSQLAQHMKTKHPDFPKEG